MPSTKAGLLALVVFAALVSIGGGYGFGTLVKIMSGPSLSPPLPAAYLVLPLLPVTVYNNKGGGRLATIGVTLTFSDTENYEATKSLETNIIDRVIRSVHETSVEDLNTEADFEILRTQLRREIDQIIAPAEISNVLIRDLSVR